jgi:hypothetical protein
VPGVFAALLRVHLILAASATVAFWLAACAPKGGRFHRAVGRRFSFLIYATAVTGGVMAVAQLVAPSAAHPLDPSVSPDTAAATIRLTRQTMWLVLYVLVIIVAPVQHGLATVAAGAQPMRIRSRLHAALSLLGIAGSVLFLPAVIAWQQWTWLIITPIGFIVGVRNLAYANRPFATPGEWQREHFTSLVTAGISLHTVMFVFMVSRTMRMTLTGWTALAPWTVPALIGLPIIFWLRRRWRARTVWGGASAPPPRPPSRP